jgi:hypothetical protein
MEHSGLFAALSEIIIHRSGGGEVGREESHLSLRIVGKTCGTAAIRSQCTQLGILQECGATRIHRQQKHCGGACNTQDCGYFFSFIITSGPAKTFR